MTRPEQGKSFTLERIILQQSVIIEEIRDLKRWVEEQIADSKLETSAQIKSTQAAISDTKSQLHELNQSLKIIMKGVVTY